MTRDRLRHIDPLSTLALAALTAVTAVSMSRLFPDWEFLRPMLLAALGVHVVAVALRWFKVPAMAAAPVLAAAVAECVALAQYRTTMKFGVPSGQTISLLRADLQTVVDQFATAVPPVPSSGAFAVVATVTLAVCAATADSFAFRGRGRLEAIVPTGALFVVVSAVGTDRHRTVVTVVWIAVALLVIALIRFHQIGERASWMSGRRHHVAAALVPIAAMAATVGIVAAVVAPRLPGADGEALINAKNARESVTEVLSPMVDIGGQLRDRSNVELFTVSSSDGPHYWRVIGLPNFDGRSWEPGEEALQPLSSDTIDTTGSVVQQIVTISALGGHLVPAAYTPTAVSPDVVSWAPESESLVLSGSELQRDDRIAITSSVRDLTPELLRGASVSRAPSTVYYSLPADTPASIGALAGQVTAGAITAYDAVIQLQSYFRSQFTYDLEVNYGNDLNAIEAFLAARRGFCQQFAGTFAVMARSLGIPARVAVGFTPGDYGTDGRFHVYDRHAHAWPEVWFDGIGWVAFEPTPSRGNSDAVDYTGVLPEQVAPLDDPLVTTTTSAPDTSSTVPGGTAAPTTTVAGGSQPATSAATPTGSSSGSSSTGVVLALLIAVAVLVLWVTLVPRLARRRAMHHDRTPAGRVAAAWRRALGALSLIGAPPIGGSTPLEYVDRVAETLDLQLDDLHQLALVLTRSVYAPKSVDESTASAAERASAAIDTIVNERIDRTTALQLRVDPRLIRRRLGDDE